MDNFLKNSRRKIQVTIWATLPLVRQILESMLASSRHIQILDTVGANSELLASISSCLPDIILMYLMEDESENIEILKNVNQIAPHVRTVILSNPEGSLDQLKAVKLGAAGVVGAQQSIRTLTSAIEQVAGGDVWLNQKLIARLLYSQLPPRGKNGLNKKVFLDELTKRELEIIRMVCYGMNNKEISKQLFISPATVRHHLSSIFGKLAVEDRLNLAIYAYRYQIVRPALQTVMMASMSS